MYKSVDYSPEETIDILAEAPMRKEEKGGWCYVKILIDGKWRLLCEETLEDEVRLSVTVKRTDSLKDLRKFFSNNKLGARITYRTFAIIRGMTDG